jgi:hypothetical protein
MTGLRDLGLTGHTQRLHICALGLPRAMIDSLPPSPCVLSPPLSSVLSRSYAGKSQLLRRTTPVRRWTLYRPWPTPRPAPKTPCAPRARGRRALVRGPRQAEQCSPRRPPTVPAPPLSASFSLSLARLDAVLALEVTTATLSISTALTQDPSPKDLHAPPLLDGM